MHCDQDDLAPGASVSVHVTSSTDGTDCGTLDNTAFTTSTNDGSDQASDSITVNCAAIGIEKTADRPTVNAGDRSSTRSP